MTFMSLPPSVILLVGALFVPLLKGPVRYVYLAALPLLGLMNVLAMPEGSWYAFQFMDYRFILADAGPMARVFGIVFHLAAFASILFLIRSKNALELSAALAYAGCALGVVYAGDWISFFFFWEGLTVTSVFLILTRNTPESRRSAFRYFMVHATGGLILLAGIVINLHYGGSPYVNILNLAAPGAWLIFLGFGINCAWPLLHAWLVDSYPEASIGGAVFLSAFTTKTAVFALAKVFPGTTLLIWIGVAMAVLPLLYAALESNIRRILSYSLINQLGFMLVGIGIGTELSLNGTAAHAFAHIIYKGLLFMVAGAVIYRTGKTNTSDLGGLLPNMPWTASFAMIAGAAMSAPFFSGFVSKSMIITASGDEHYYIAWFALVFATAGVLLFTGIKIPYLIFFGKRHEHHKPIKEAPGNMLAGMGILAFFCVFLGIYPDFLYNLLPFNVDYKPYTYNHIIGQFQLIAFTFLAFYLLLQTGLYPKVSRSIYLDVDWFYRKGFRGIYIFLDRVFNGINAGFAEIFAWFIPRSLAGFFRDGPANLTLWVLKPVWKFSGLSPAQIADKEYDLRLTYSRGGLPVALPGIMALITMTVIIFLRMKF